MITWIKDLINKPSDFWLAMSDFNKQYEDVLMNQLKENQNNLDFEAARKLADDLFGIKS